MVSFKYALTKEDYINYYTYVSWDAPGNKKKRLFYYGRQALTLLLFLFAFYYTGLFQRNTTFILIISGFLIGTGLLSLLGVRTNAMREAERATNDPSNVSFFINTDVVVSEVGISIKSDLKETLYKWPSIIKRLESRNYYFLFHNAVQAIIIPKRVFISTSEKAAFEKLLAQNLTLDAEVSHLLKQ